MPARSCSGGWGSAPTTFTVQALPIVSPDNRVSPDSGVWPDCQAGCVAQPASTSPPAISSARIKLLRQHFKGGVVSGVAFLHVGHAGALILDAGIQPVQP